MNPNNIALVPVQSSNIAAVGYHVQSKTLVVSFINGGLYSYAGVPKEVALGFFTPVMNEGNNGDVFFAKRSVGRYFIAQVKNAYVTTKIR